MRITKSVVKTLSRRPRRPWKPRVFRASGRSDSYSHSTRYFCEYLNLIIYTFITYLYLCFFSSTPFQSFSVSKQYHAWYCKNSDRTSLAAIIIHAVFRFQAFLSKLFTISFFDIKGSLYQQAITHSPSKWSFWAAHGFWWNRIAEAIIASSVLKLTIRVGFSG